MLHIYEGDPETDANEHRDGTDQDDRLSRVSSNQLSLPMHIPRNRSTGNLALPLDTPDKARFRLSFDAGAAAAEYDNMARSPIMTDHDHGMGRSGLRRIRQHVPNPANAPSRNSSVNMPRSASMTTIQSRNFSPNSPAFTEDLTRFSAESLHSFSFAHQSEEILHNRQNILKRSVEFMQDRMGWPATSNAGLASAQARASGDVDTQNMLDLLARAQLVSANNLPSSDPEHSAISGPLSGPASLTNENVFDKSFFPRTTSPEPLTETEPNSALPSPLLTRHFPADDAISPLHGSPVISPSGSGDDGNSNLHTDKDSTRLSVPDTAAAAAALPTASGESSRTPTNESGTTQRTSPPGSRPASLVLRRSMTDTTSAAVQQKLMEMLTKPFVPSSTEAQTLPGAAGHRPLPVSTDQQYELAGSSISSTGLQPLASPMSLAGSMSTAVHSHASRWVPAAQAIFTTESKPPWTIIAANDLACLVFGVTRAEVRKMGILEVVQEERRAWLEKKLLHADPDEDVNEPPPKEPESVSVTPRSSSSSSRSLFGSRTGGITAKLLSKPSSRAQTPQSSQHRQFSVQTKEQQRLLQARRANTVHAGDLRPPKSSGSAHHHHTNSRGVLLCGDVVPIRKRNGATGSASLWVKEKRVGLIWVLEEIHEDVATVTVDDDGYTTDITGSLGPIWGDESLQPGIEIGKLLSRIPRLGADSWTGPVDFAEVAKRKYYTCRNCDRINIPASVEVVQGKQTLRISSFPHIAGIVVVSTQTLAIKSSNSVFAGALFGYEKPNGHMINELIPDFDKILQILIDEDNIHLVDGMVVPEHNFRKAAAFLALRQGRADAETTFMRPEGLTAHHRDGSKLRIDVQMRVVKSEKQTKIREETVIEEDEDGEEDSSTTASSMAGDSTHSTFTVSQSEMVYALWITYSRHLHATRQNLGVASPLLSGFATPLHQPSPGQTPVHSPAEMSPQPIGGRRDQLQLSPRRLNERTSAAQALTRQLENVAQVVDPRASSLQLPAGAASGRVRVPSSTMSLLAARRMQMGKPGATGPMLPPPSAAAAVESKVAAGTTTTSPDEAVPPHKKTIDDFVIVEEMGQGAYGQVKLAKYKATGKRVIIKYVTKRRILVDTWTRDRRLGTVPLEIHVLDYLRRDGLQHPNIVEMEDFFEDDVNYYIEMVPHGLPGMDLFDYIELRRNMEEAECQSIFVQVAKAIHHLHTKAMVVHRDIKDENVVLDGDGHIRLIDFGSAAYIKSGPFDVFVGTIDYAAPEVLAGNPYGGKEQDVWALGILLYTIIYKENPFYSIDEIMDRDLRVPYTISDESIDLIRQMLNRDVGQRYTIGQVLQHPWCQMEIDV